MKWMLSIRLTEMALLVNDLNILMSLFTVITVLHLCCTKCGKREKTRHNTVNAHLDVVTSSRLNPT